MIRLLVRNTDREEGIIRQIRELAQEIDSRQLKVKRAAKVIRGYLPEWRPWWKIRNRERNQ